MKLVRAGSFLDGGTVYVEIEHEGQVSEFMLDYSLPWDNRPRYISVVEKDSRRDVAIGSEEEKNICKSIRGLLEEKYGEAIVRMALETADARKAAWEEHCAKQSLFVSLEGYDDPHPLPFIGIWSVAYRFLEKAWREGKL